MTEKQINKLAKEIAKQVISEMDAVISFAGFNQKIQEDEGDLLSELASAMTSLDYNLKKENYIKCKELQDKIKIIEQKLRKFE